MLVLVVVGVGAAVFALGGIQTGTAASTEYLTSAATTGDVTDDVAATGTLAAQPQLRPGLRGRSVPGHRQQHRPRPPDDLPVKEVKVVVGDSVKKGDVLATADTTDLRDLATAENTLDSARVSLRVAKTSLTDAKDADVHRPDPPGHHRSPQRREPARPGEAGVNDLKTQIAAATLKSPVDGIVTEVNISAGFDAPSGTAIVVEFAGVPGHDRRGRERPRRRQGRAGRRSR